MVATAELSTEGPRPCCKRGSPRVLNEFLVDLGDDLGVVIAEKEVSGGSALPTPTCGSSKELRDLGRLFTARSVESHPSVVYRVGPFREGEPTNRLDLALRHVRPPEGSRGIMLPGQPPRASCFLKGTLAETSRGSSRAISPPLAGLAGDPACGRLRFPSGTEYPHTSFPQG